jgi:hypothetical protein
MSAPESSRVAFEAWFSDGGQSMRAIERKGDSYVLMQASAAWIAYAKGRKDEREEWAPVLAALRELANDVAERFDMDSPSTNPGMRAAVKDAHAAIAAVTTPASKAACNVKDDAAE